MEHAVTVIDNHRADALRQVLQAQFDQQTAELTRLVKDRSDHGGPDPHTTASLIVAARRALADTTEALKRMVDGTYGICQHCGRRIPVERLEILPQARFCVPCQRDRGR
jgi:DnaK suppressor protein